MAVRSTILAVAAALAVATPASADIVPASPAGFVIDQTLSIAAPPAKVWATLIQPARWWSKEHSYSGASANLTLEPRAGGCWCEKLSDGGSVEHMRVVMFAPNETLRLVGGLGPLQAAAVSATLTVELKAEGGGTILHYSYVVGGFMRPSLDAVALPVKQVLDAQFINLKTAAEAK
jgi:uncharacterized protein YndB with AHSA1/START domain